MRRNQQQVVLITGASSGIGEATANAFAARGARVVLAARNEMALHRVAAGIRNRGAEVLVVPTDVTVDEQCQALVARTVEAFGSLDVLVNNAGVSTRGTVYNLEMPVTRKAMAVNFFGAVACTQAALPHLLLHKGVIVVVSSVVGKVAIPGRAPYSASKFAMHGYFEAIRCELKPRGVHVLMVCPGFVDTPIRTNALGPDGEVTGKPGRTVGPMMSAERVAKAVVSGTYHRKREIVLTPLAKTLVFLRSNAPRLTEWILSRSVDA